MSISSGVRAAAAVAALAGIALAAAPASGAINVERGGSENPVVEVARSTIYGGLAGLVVGSSIALATDDSEHDGDYVRVGFAAGTICGLLGGIWWVSRRPQPAALLDFGADGLALHPPLPVAGPAGSVRVPVVSVRF